MCNPAVLAAVPMVIGMTGDAMSYFDQKDAQEANRLAANESASSQIQQIQLQQQQQAQASSRSIFQNDLESRRSQAITAVSAGESGVAGLSVDMLLNDIERKRLQMVTDEKMNMQSVAQQTALNKQAVLAERDARIAGVPGPSLGATLATSGGRIAGAAADYWGKLPPKVKEK